MSRWPRRLSRWLFLGIFLLGSSPIVALAEDVKLGYVDMQRALNETEDGRKAKAKLEAEFKKKQKEIDEQQDALKKEIEDFQKKRTLLTADKVAQKESEFQERMQKLQQTYLRHQQDLSGKEQAETGKIFERMSRIIQKIAQAENFTMILDKNQSAVLWAKPHLDLTNELIRRYNGGEGAGPSSGGGAPAAGGGAAAASPKK